MRFPFAVVALALLAAPAPAADLSPLYPEHTIAVMSIDITGVTNSPLGKKVIGTDKPFTASRKLVSVLLDDKSLTFPDAARKHLAEQANKLERITLVVTLKPEGGFGLSVAAFLEGPNTEDDYIKAVEGYAKASEEKFEIEKRGNRKLLSLPGTGFRGASVNKSLFVVADKEELMTEVLDLADGKKKPTGNKAINDAVKQVKPTETPIWLVLAHEQLGSAVATIALKDDADFRLEYRAGTMDYTVTVRDLLKSLFDDLAKKDTRQGRVWAAAKIVVKLDDKVVTATGKFPGKLLAEEYAKQD